MGTRLELQSKLEELIGCKHVYYQPPKSVKMEYPAIRYSKKSIAVDHADEHLTASSIHDIPLMPKSEQAISGLKDSSQVIL